jgi:hypothetical protein
MCWWPNLIWLEKPDSPVLGSRYSNFGSFRANSKKEITQRNMNSRVYW